MEAATAQISHILSYAQRRHHHHQHYHHHHLSSIIYRLLESAKRLIVLCGIVVFRITLTRD